MVAAEIKFKYDVHALRRASDGWHIQVLKIKDLHVCPIGQGIGSGMLRFFEVFSERSGCELAAVFVEEKEKKFYEKGGWIVTDYVISNKTLVLSKDVKIRRDIEEIDHGIW
jgi:hypothetical protein